MQWLQRCTSASVSMAEAACAGPRAGTAPRRKHTGKRTLDHFHAASSFTSSAHVDTYSMLSGEMMVLTADAVALERNCRGQVTRSQGITGTWTRQGYGKPRNQ